MKRLLLVLGLAAVTATALCGCTAPSGSPHWTTSDATAKATSRSIAAATVDYLGLTATYAAPSTTLFNFPTGAIGADVTMLVHGKKIHVTTIASPKPWKYQVTSCAHHAPYDGCRELTVNGNKQITVWQYLEPEEDGGILEITSFRGNGTVNVDFSGPDITKSPLKGGIPIDEARLEELAASPVLGFRTTPTYFSDGAKLSVWHVQNRG